MLAATLLSALPWTLLGTSLEPSLAAGETVKRLLGAMGTGLSLEVTAEARTTALQASEAAVRAIEAVEARLSTWGDTSELARLNQAGGQWVELSEASALDLSTALRLARATDGLFDPCLGTLVEVWGLRRGGVLPSPIDLAAARRSAGHGLLELTGRNARLLAGARIEEGAFGKGAGLAAGAQAALAAGAERVILDLGGQWCSAGPGELAVELASPADRKRPILRLFLPAGSLSTSADSEHAWSAGGQSFGHLLDPRKGQPLRIEGRSASVFARDALVADALSTAASLDPEGVLAALAAEQAALLLIEVQDEQLRVRTTKDFPGRLEPLGAIELLAGSLGGTSSVRPPPPAPPRGGTPH